MTNDGAAIFVLVDALGWELLRGRAFLEDILAERRPVETILGYSSGAIPSLLTGSYPRAHGHWNLFYRAPHTSPFRWAAPLGHLPRPLRENRFVRRGVREISRRLCGYSGYFAIYNLPLERIRHFDICEKTDIYQPGGLAPARSLFDALVEAAVPYECYNYHRHTDEQILELVPRRLATSDCRLYFLYLCGLDAFLHFHIRDAAGVEAKLRWYEEGLRRIHRAARSRWGRATLHVFSDHGMTPIAGTRDLMAEVEKLGLTADDYLPAYDSTMARFWFFSERAETRIRHLLGELDFGRILSERELAELGLDFEDDRYGQLVYVMEPGILICPSDMGRIRFGGMHGFHPREDPFAHAVFLSSEPVSAPVRHITDVLPVLLDTAGLHHPLELATSPPGREGRC